MLLQRAIEETRIAFLDALDDYSPSDLVNLRTPLRALLAIASQ